MIVVVGAEKGGVGKSAIATNLAAWLAGRGEDVILVDTDRQSMTAANWASVRAENKALPAVHCVQKYGNVFATVRDLATRYAHVIVDAGGRDSEELRSALVAAELLLVPLRPSQPDLWTVEHLDQVVTLARGLNPELAPRFVLTMASTNPRVNEVDEALEALAEYDQFAMCETVVRMRKAYGDAIRDGCGVIEGSNDKAQDEINQLAKEVYGGIFEQTENDKIIRLAIA